MKEEEPIEPDVIPEFADEQEEQAFWETHDAIDYIAWTDAKNVEPPVHKTGARHVGLQLPDELVNAIASVAHARGLAIETLIANWLSEKLAESK